MFLNLAYIKKKEEVVNTIKWQNQDIENLAG